MDTCMTCGMPFDGAHQGDVGLELPEGKVCKFDIENGAVKSPEAIFAGGVAFFSQYTDGDRALAERLTRTNMKSLPHWRAHPFAELEGREATDEEFANAVSKLGSL